MIILDKATIVTAEKEAVGTILIEGTKISSVIWSDSEDYDFRRFKMLNEHPDVEVWDLEGRHVMAGGIDAHVHFREPGL